MIALQRFRRRHLKHYLMLLPFLILFTMFSLWPTIYGVGISFTKWDGVNTPEYVGFENYDRLFNKNPNFDPAMSNLFKFITRVIPIGIGLSLGISLLVNQFTGRAYRFFRSAYFLPTIIPMYLAASIWIWMLTPEVGVVTNILAFFGMDDIKWLTDRKYTGYSIVMVDLWRATGFNMVLLTAGLKAIPREYYEAASVDGANTLQQMRHISIPLLEPVLFLVIVNAFIGGLQLFDAPWLMSASKYGDYGGTRDAMLYPVMEIVGLTWGRSRFGEASALAVTLMMIIAAITAVQFTWRWWRYGRQ